MTNFDALKQIYEALGGDEEITGTNLDALKAIAEVAGSGGGGGGLVVHATQGAGAIVLDKTWQEIHDAMAAGTSAFVVVPPTVEGEPTTVFPAIECNFAGSDYQGGGYAVVIHNFLSLAETKYFVFQCNAASGYPACSINPDD